MVIINNDMELKKNPEVEVSRFGIIYFQVGLCFMMLLTYLGLEYKSYQPLSTSAKIVMFDVSYESSFEDDIPVMTIKTPVTSVALIALGNEGIKVVDNLATVKETYMESTEIGQLDVIGEVIENHTPILKVDDIHVKKLEEDVEIPFALIESAPIFPGCENGSKEEIKECFNMKILEHISKNFIYPEKAIDRRLYGKVFVLFTIDKSGNVTNLQSRGPDKILENEAERIIGLLPKMIPGKQRGKPAKVKYSVPIYFKYVEN